MSPAAAKKAPVANTETVTATFLPAGDTKGTYKLEVSGLAEGQRMSVGTNNCYVLKEWTNGRKVAKVTATYVVEFE